MSDLTVDASVWIAVADPSDVFHEESRTFLAAVAHEDTRLVVPAFATTEVACALARRLRDPVLARTLTQELLPTDEVLQVPTDALLLTMAVRLGTDARLRGADALYAATAALTGSTLVSWDNELIQRAGALSPAAWLDASR